MSKLAFFLFIAVSLILTPVVGIMSINILLDQSGSVHQVPHNVLTYFGMYGIAFVLRSAK